MEDFLPMQAICAQPSHEKSVHEGHVFTLHFWWPAERGIICPNRHPHDLRLTFDGSQPALCCARPNPGCLTP